MIFNFGESGIHESKIVIDLKALCVDTELKDKKDNNILNLDIIHFQFFDKRKGYINIFRIVKYKKGRYVAEFLQGDIIPKFNDEDLRVSLMNGYTRIGSALSEDISLLMREAKNG